MEPHRNTKGDSKISIPTQALALKWLRVKHQIHISTVHYNGDYKWEYSINTMQDDDVYDEQGFNSHEEAIEAALLYTLKELL